MSHHEGNRERAWHRRVCALVLVISLAFLLFLPAMLSTSLGLRSALFWTNHAIEGRVEVKKLHLSWFGPQEIEDFVYFNKEGKEVLSFHLFSTEGRLLSFVTGSCFFRKTSLIEPKVHIVEEEEKPLDVRSMFKKREHTSHRWRCFRGDLHIEKGELLFEAPGIRPITLSHLEATYRDDASLFHLTAKTNQSAIDGSILLSGKLGEEMQVLADIKSFPVALLDEMAKMPLFTRLIGFALDAHLEVKRSGPEVTLDASLSSPYLQGTVKGATHEGLFRFDPTSEILLTVTPQLVSDLLGPVKLHLANKADLVFKMEDVAYPLSKRVSLPPFRIAAKSERAEFTLENYGNVALEEGEVTVVWDEHLSVTYACNLIGKSGTTPIKGSVQRTRNRTYLFSAEFANLPLDFLEHMAGKELKLPTLFGPTTDLSFKGKYKDGALDTDFIFASENMRMAGAITGDRLQSLIVKAEGETRMPERLTPYLGTEAKVTLQCHLAYSDKLSLENLLLYIENNAFEVDITAKAADIGDLRTWHMLLLSKISHLGWPKAQGRYAVGNLSLDLDGQKNALTGTLALSLPDGGTENIEIKGMANSLITNNAIDFSKAEVVLQGEATQIPLSLIETVSSQPLTQFIGESLDFTFDAHKTGSEHILALSVFAKGEGFSADFSIFLNSHLKIAQDKKAVVYWELTPQRYAALAHLISKEGQLPYRLSQTVPLELEITDFTCPSPLPSSLGALVCQSGFVGELYVAGDVVFVPVDKGAPLAFKEVKGSLRGVDFSKEINIVLQGEVNAAEKSGFTLELKVEDLFVHGGVSPASARMKGDLKLDLIPTKPFLGMISMPALQRERLQALLGDFLNARIFGELSHFSGPLTCDVKASNFKAFLPLYLNEGTVQLQKTVEVELTLTPEVSGAFFNDLNPLLITGAWSDRPIKLYIDQEGFSLPLRPFVFERVQVPLAIIDLGQIVVRNGAEIQALMDFLKVKAISQEGVMQAWFTPLYLTLQNGVVTYKRFDILLAETVHIALWGRIDFINDRVSMMLGISPSTFQQRFNIGIGKKDMFQVKMRGTTKSLDLDWSSAYTRLGILIASSAGGHLGSIVGGVIEHIVTAGDEPTPPPTTYPLPWHEH